MSRLMPGMSDYVSVETKEGKREHVQKKLLLCNLNELYAQYTQEYPDIKIGLTKFTQLSPARCILAGSSGTHNSASTKKLKLYLSAGQLIVCFDFAENYAFVVQNAAQSFHPNDNQATIFTVVIYFMENGELKHYNLAMIPDNLNHDTFAVHQFQEIIIEYLKQHFELISKIIYVSDEHSHHSEDGSNFANILKHEEDFGIPARWHHHATAHGKRTCDGIGANLKRGAKRASLQRTSQNHILTAQALYEWAKVYCKETDVFLSPTEDYEKYHAHIPTLDRKLQCMKSSSSVESDLFPKEKKSRIAQAKVRKGEPSRKSSA
ncbi:hypothetical protein QAD02_003384 [Eretmocerus hayati]|uniref:Uncharacterized protein n=1 Tax=Eretmocerus hayati TaxID=131215 RepID=A0ACC2NLQ6_9HYME|nr:hypothetical protein QAD02_003384 [Eretmocerus hayati]